MSIFAETIILFVILLFCYGKCDSNTSFVCGCYDKATKQYGFEYFSDAEHMKCEGCIVVSHVYIVDGTNKTGWAEQFVTSSPIVEDHIQAYFAGFLETNSSLKLTNAYWNNTVGDLCPKPYSKDCLKLKKILGENMDRMITKSLHLGETDYFWHQVENMLWQLVGISDAYHGRFVNTSSLLVPMYLENLVDEILDIYLLQLSGDLGEILQAFNLPELHSSVNRLGVKLSELLSSCSALIKVLPNNQDILFSHVTWSSYVTMLRVIKHYDFGWRVRRKSGSGIIPGRKISFSSYPSVIGSIDDFYILGNGLVTMETTIGNYNNSLWQVVRDNFDEMVPEYLRVMVANRLARNGREWVQYFASHNSGTYNNQWMILDYNKFTPNKPIDKQWTLTVAEQLPGIVFYQDLTNHLSTTGYWSSYNIPYFTEAYTLAGFAEKEKQFGDFFSYENAARSKIFKRNQSSVVDISSMYKLMRYNNFKQDPLSACKCSPPYSGENAISARCDLNLVNGTYPLGNLGYRIHGAIDVKITSYIKAKQMAMWAANGPTYDQQPAFKWSTLQKPQKRPALLPDEIKFGLLQFGANLAKNRHFTPYL